MQGVLELTTYSIPHKMLNYSALDSRTGCACFSFNGVFETPSLPRTYHQLNHQQIELGQTFGECVCVGPPCYKNGNIMSFLNARNLGEKQRIELVSIDSDTFEHPKNITLRRSSKLQPRSSSFMSKISSMGTSIQSVTRSLAWLTPSPWSPSR